MRLVKGCGYPYTMNTLKEMNKYYCLIVNYNMLGVTMPDYFFFSNEPQKYKGAVEMYNYAIQNGLKVSVRKIETDLDFDQLDFKVDTWEDCTSEFYS